MLGRGIAFSSLSCANLGKSCKFAGVCGFNASRFMSVLFFQYVGLGFAQDWMTMDPAQMMAMSMQMRSDAMEAQRVARNYAKAAKRSLKQVESLKKDFGAKRLENTH